MDITKRDGKVSKFNTVWYDKYPWLTGSVTSKGLYCWPCLLMRNSQTWTVDGFADIKNLDRATKRHDECKDHVGAAIRLKMLGIMPIDQAVDEGRKIQTTQHNAGDRRNRDILND